MNVNKAKARGGIGFAFLHKRGGSIMIPALFLMVFFVALGGALLSVSQAGIGATAAAVNTRQAYYSAKSALDLVAEALTGEYTINDETAQPFKSLNRIIAPLTTGQKVTATGDVAGKATVEIKCTGLEKLTDNTEKQALLISATADSGTYTRTVSRDVVLLRKKGGRLEGMNLGSEENNPAPAEYIIKGKAFAKTTISGDVRIENAYTLDMSDVIVEGNLFVSAFGAVNLTNVTVNGSVLLETEHEAITLNNCQVKSGKDTVLKTGGKIEVIKKFTSAGSVFVNAAFGMKTPFGDNKLQAPFVYLANGSGITGGGSGSVNGSIIDGDAATQAYSAAYVRGNPNTMKLTIQKPNAFDYEIKSIAKLAEDYPDGINANAGETVNMSIPQNLLSQITLLKVSGAGTINFYIKEKEEDTLFHQDIQILRTDSADTIVNFVSVDGTYPFILDSLTNSLDANIFIPHGTIQAHNTPLNGVYVAAAYLLTTDKDNAVLLTSDKKWANSGSLAVTGAETVTGTVGAYH